MRITASRLRADVYNLLDRVLESGEPLEVERNGHVLRIVPPRSGRTWVDRLPQRDGVVTGDADDLASLEPLGTWDPAEP